MSGYVHRGPVRYQLSDKCPLLDPPKTSPRCKPGPVWCHWCTTDRPGTETGTGLGWSYNVRDSQELKQNMLGTHGVTVSLTRGEDRLIDSVGGLSCVSCVFTKVHMSNLTYVQKHRLWMTTQSSRSTSVSLGPYHWNTGIRDVVVGFCWSKFV